MGKGGYQIIDFKDIDLTIDGDGVTIDGVYERLEGNYRKPTFVEGLSVGGVEKTGQYVAFTVSGDDFVGNIIVGGTAYLCTITNADLVTLTTIA